MRPILLTTSALLLATSAASAAEPTFYIGGSFASYHVNSKYDFNEFNPGISLGVDWSKGEWDYGIEGGAYHNSYEDRSLYLLGNLDYRVAQVGPVGLRLGVFAGIAEYSNLTQEASDAGLPTAGDYIPVGGAMLTARFYDRVDLRFRLMPTTGDAAAVFGFQILYRFNWSE